jgi:hypothetical protein
MMWRHLNQEKAILSNQRRLSTWIKTGQKNNAIKARVRTALGDYKRAENTTQMAQRVLMMLFSCRPQLFLPTSHECPPLFSKLLSLFFFIFLCVCACLASCSKSKKKKHTPSVVAQPKVITLSTSPAKKRQNPVPKKESPGVAEPVVEQKWELSDEDLNEMSEGESESDREDDDADFIANDMNKLDWDEWDERDEVPPELERREPKTKQLPNDTSVWTPFDFVALFLSRKLIKHIKKQTNIYAEQSREAGGLSAQGKGRKWEPCCAVTVFFYSLRVYRYAGKGSTVEAHGLTTDSVTTLLDAGCIEKGSVVYFDRWFTSPLLLIELLRRGVYGVGTVMLNRSGLPADLKMEKSTKRHPIASGSMCLYKCAVKVKLALYELYAVSWMDKKPVSFVGTAHGLSTTTCERTGKTTGAKVPVDIVLMPRMYQKWMDGVDHGDQLKMQYGLAKKFISFKPWMKLFVGLFDILLTNAYIIYCAKTAKEGRDRISQYKVLWDVVNGLLSMGDRQHFFGDGHDARISCKRILIGGFKNANCIH